MSLLDRRYFTFSEDEESLVREFSPVYHLSQQDATKIAPLFVARAGLDREFLNNSIDEFVGVANKRNMMITFMNHPQGEHGFDVLNENARTREIIKAAVAFFGEHLEG